MQKKHSLFRAILAGVTFLGAGLAGNIACAGLVSGDLLVNNFNSNTFQQNPLIPGNNIQEYSTLTTSLMQTYTASGLAWEGASVTPNGLLATTYRNDSNGNYNPGIYLFNGTGAVVSTFKTPEITTFGAGDISAFADGTLAVSDQGGSVIRKYSQAGVSLGSIALPGSADVFGNTIDPANTMWAADSAGHHLFHINESGSSVTTLNLTFAPSDLAIDPNDSSLWVADQTNSSVDHLSSSGAVLSTFTVTLPTGGVITGIAIDPSSELYVVGNNSTAVDVFSTIGHLDSTIPITPTNSQHLFLNIVPSGISNIPEPSSVCMLILGSIGIVGRRPRRKDATTSTIEK
ncbi:MAG: hypothetical protein M3O30_07940 [Planctomycetota bacterium]|nr:hypothetical protein [Planctomycetota bacterium]